MSTCSDSSGYRIGIDVGGTFTDLVAIDDWGRITTAKSASTPRDQSVGVLDGLELLADALGIDRPALLRATERIVHGTTVATNALLERKGAKLGLLTTEGHRDVLEMREGLKDDRYALRQPAPDPLVPRHLRLPVRERIRADGTASTPLKHASMSSAIRTLAAEQIFEVEVPLDRIDWSGPDPIAAIADAFHARHEALYTYSLRDQEAVLVNARLAVVGRLPAVPGEPVLAQGSPAAPGGARRVYLGPWRELSVYRLDTLAPGQRIEGPAIVESAATTVLLRSGDVAHATPYGWLDIDIAAK